jgi:hypothetical protein
MREMGEEGRRKRRERWKESFVGMRGERRKVRW